MDYCGMQQYREMTAETISSKKDYTQSDVLSMCMFYALR